MLIVLVLHAGAALAFDIDALNRNAGAMQTGNGGGSSSKAGAYWDLGFGVGFMAVGALGLVKSGSAADAGDEADELSAQYAEQFLFDWADAGYFYGLWEEDQAFHGGGSSALLWSYYQQSLSSAAYNVNLGSEQADIADEKQDEERLWKGIAYASLAAGSVFLVKAIIGLTSSDGNAGGETGTGGFHMISSVGQESTLGLSYRF